MDAFELPCRIGCRRTMNSRTVMIEIVLWGPPCLATGVVILWVLLYSPPYRAARLDPVSNTTDFEVIEAVLQHVHADPRFCPKGFRRTTGRVALAGCTPSGTNITSVAGAMLSADAQKWIGAEIHADMATEFRKRNKSSTSLVGYPTGTTNVVFLAYAAPVRWGYMLSDMGMPSDCRGGVAAYLPAYSADTTTAVVVFVVFPDYHSKSSGTYVLRKVQTTWRVQAGKLFHFY